MNDLRFMRDERCLVTGTGAHQVCRGDLNCFKIRVYDPRAQRRPVKQLQWLEEPITAVALAANDRPQHVFAGNTKGEMALFDLRNRRMIMIMSML